MYVGGQNEDWEIPKVDLPKVSCSVKTSNYHLQTLICHLLVSMHNLVA